MIDVATGKPVWAVGFMTGTSMDGVDAALLRTDGETIAAFGPSHYWPYDAPTRQAAEQAIAWAARQPTATLAGMQSGAIAWAPEHQALTARLTQVHRDCAAALAGRAEDGGCAGVLAGVHGQTIAHRPDEAFTLQVAIAPGALPWPSIVDFRSADVGLGGQGAPLAPFYHHALVRYIAADAPVAFLNIGGVANVTWVDPACRTPSQPGALVAFDTGPGNALVNDWVSRQTGAEYDANGAHAAAGRVHSDRLASNFGQAYLDRRPPKSLDRNDFHGVLAAMEGVSVADGAATLTAFTAECVAASIAHMPSPPTRWLVCGGGRHNATMMRMMQERLNAPVDPVEAVGLDGDMMEAQAFAYLAVRVLRGLPTSAPSTTGCREPVCGGRITPPRDMD